MSARGKPTKGMGTGNDRVHQIDLDQLIIHRYAERAMLLKRADAVARDIIRNEMREGESFRTSKDGTYFLVFPKLTSEAGALRASLIAEKIFREVRRINPASVALDSNLRKDARKEPQRPLRVNARFVGSSRPASSHAPAAPGPAANADRVIKESATRAFERMIESNPAHQGKHLVLSDNDRQVLTTLRVRFHPVWHIRNNMITGYRCGLSHMGRDITMLQAVALMGPGPAEIIKAKIDAAVYAQAVNGVQYLLQQSQQAVLIVPIHYSTVDHLRYMAPLLEVGSNLPSQATSLLVFEFLEFPQSASRFRLREPVSYLRPRARALVGRIGLDFSNLDALLELGFHGISLDLDDYSWSEPRLMPLFDSFVAAAQARRLQPFIHGIRTPSLTVAAISAGFTYVDGPAVSHPSDIPSHMQAFGVHSMYMDWRRPPEGVDAGLDASAG